MGRGGVGRGAKFAQERFQPAAFQMAASGLGLYSGGNLSVGSVGRTRSRSWNCEVWIRRRRLLDRFTLLANGASVRNVRLVLLDSSTIHGHVHLYVAEFRHKLTRARRNRVARNHLSAGGRPSILRGKTERDATHAGQHLMRGRYELGTFT